MIQNLILQEDTIILTCKLGNEIINCYDGLHNKEQLKKWASKKILLCPVCDKPYEYCHGEVKTPYFRHMDKNECEDKYSESETEEHLNGKRDLFEWIKKQNGVTKAVLEGWIPETKQRPDIMFEYNGKKYVIEYQCSPIATEYVERHELYKASGIIDIWICGIEKYFQKNMRKKFIQDYVYGFYSYTNKYFIPTLSSYISKTKLPYLQYYGIWGNFYGLPIYQFVFDGTIYNLKIGKAEDIRKKLENRQKIKETCYFDYSKRHNKYLDIQNDKLYEQIKNNLSKLCNNNWIFHISQSYSRYKRYDFIVAEPIEAYKIYDRCFENDVRRKKYKRINMERLRKENYDLYKKCARDISVLKAILLDMMIYNKQVLLKYRDENIRFMEVRDN